MYHPLPSWFQRPPPDGSPAQDPVRVLRHPHARLVPPTVPRTGVGAGRRLERWHDWQPGGAGGDEAAPGSDVVEVDEVASEQRAEKELRRHDHQVRSTIVLYYLLTYLFILFIRFRALLPCCIFCTSADLLPFVQLSRHSPPPHLSSTSFSQYLFGIPLFLWPFNFRSRINFSSVWCLSICPKFSTRARKSLNSTEFHSLTKQSEIADPRSLGSTFDVIVHFFVMRHVWHHHVIWCHIWPYLAMVKNPLIYSGVKITFPIRIILKEGQAMCIHLFV